MKRFTETTKWDDPWYRSLSPTTKLLWLWLLDHCDIAGVIRPDLGLASFQIGQTINEQNIIELGDRVEALEGGKFLIVKFVPFQFGELSPASQVHRSVIKTFQSHGLQPPNPKTTICQPLTKPSPTLDQGLDRGSPTPKDKDKEKENTKEGGTRGKPTLDEVMDFVVKSNLPESDAIWFWNKCEANGWMNGRHKIKSWTHTIVAWKAGGYMPSQKNGNGAPGNGKPMSPLDYRTIIQAKETQATELYNRHCSESALSKIWDSDTHRQQFVKLKQEVRELNARLGALGGAS